MAIGLEDVKKSKKKIVDEQSQSHDKTLRPWQSFESNEFGTRTPRAQDAVKRARDIVDRNNQVITELRTEWMKEGLQLSENHLKHEIRLTQEKVIINSKISAKPKKSGLFKIFKEIFE